MQVFILAAQTADGYVARNPSQTSREWTGYQDKRLFTWLTKQAKVAVIGHNTYKTFDQPFPRRRTIVYTMKPHEQAAKDGVEFTNEPPAQLLKRLESEGEPGVAICGGAAIYDLFMRAGLVHDFYLTIQPHFFGEGLKLFTNPMQKSLELLETQVSTADQTVILHYVERDHQTDTLAKRTASTN
jgi:dihydrofolate reductase